MEAQEGRCYICRKKASGKGPSGQRLHIDHDPKTGKVRGLLCFSCNVGLGHFRHNPKLLLKAVRYLLK
jgi:hypothetical protein